jgi:hypothetical protein
MLKKYVFAKAEATDGKNGGYWGNLLPLKN